MQKKLTDSSSFSMPLGIWGTARFMAEYSGKSGSSSAKYIGIGLVGSRALALNDSFDIFVGDLTAQPTKHKSGWCGFDAKMNKYALKTYFPGPQSGLMDRYKYFAPPISFPL